MTCGNQTKHSNEVAEREGGTQAQQQENVFKPFNYESSEIQKIMDTAYARWNSGDLQNLNYKEFVDALSLREKIVVVFGNLNYQVYNGGFAQWQGNGYDVVAPVLVEALGKLPKYGPEVAALVKHLVNEKERFENLYADYRQDYEMWGWDIPHEPDREDFDDEESYEAAVDEYEQEFADWQCEVPCEPELEYEYEGQDLDEEYYLRADHLAYELEAIVKMSDEELERWWNETPSVVPSIDEVLFGVPAPSPGTAYKSNGQTDRHRWQRLCGQGEYGSGFAGFRPGKWHKSPGEVPLRVAAAGGKPGCHVRRNASAMLPVC